VRIANIAHSTTDRAGFLPTLIALAKEKGAAGYPASSLITRRTLGWEPPQPGLLADLDNGHYFPAS
jgi:hypothetical protein